MIGQIINEKTLKINKNNKMDGKMIILK